MNFNPYIGVAKSQSLDPGDENLGTFEESISLIPLLRHNIPKDFYLQNINCFLL